MIEYFLKASTNSDTEIKSEKLIETESFEDEISNVFNAYFSEGGNNKRKPMFINSLGLAAEEPRPGVTLEMLWELHPSSK